MLVGFKSYKLLGTVLFLIGIFLYTNKGNIFKKNNYSYLNKLILTFFVLLAIFSNPDNPLSRGNNIPKLKTPFVKQQKIIKRKKQLLKMEVPTQKR